MTSNNASGVTKASLKNFISRLGRISRPGALAFPKNPHIRHRETPYGRVYRGGSVPGGARRAKLRGRMHHGVYIGPNPEFYGQGALLKPSSKKGEYLAQFDSLKGYTHGWFPMPAGNNHWVFSIY